MKLIASKRDFTASCDELALIILSLLCVYSMQVKVSYFSISNFIDILFFQFFRHSLVSYTRILIVLHHVHMHF